MIAPSDKLLFWFAALLPFLALSGMAPHTAPLTLALFLSLGLVACVDAVRARRRVGELKAFLPPLVRLARHRAGVIPITVQRETAEDAVLTLGLALPREFAAGEGALTVRLAAGLTTGRADWPCLPATRGLYRVDRCFVQLASPWGLWRARGAPGCQSEIRVYPDLLGDERGMALAFLNRPAVGIHRQRLVGQGREFERLRDYLPGDSFDDVHWKATAKRGRPVTKLYQIERTQEMYVAVDCSRLSGRSSGGDPALEKFITTALALGLLARRQGDRFGVIAFSDRLLRFLRAGSGRAHYNACRDALSTLQTEPIAPDFDEFFASMRLRVRRRSLVVVLTDLADPTTAEIFARNIRALANRHVVVAGMVRPPELRPLFSAPDLEATEQLYGALAGHLLWTDLRQVERVLRRQGVKLVHAPWARLTECLAQEYLSVKARQLL